MSKQRIPEKESWRAMCRRCGDPRRTDYARYGGKGISVCQKWRDSFPAFLEDMGPRPPGTSLDRINNSGNYEPGNCRWATRSQQMRNQCRNKYVEYRGKKMCLRDWADATGISYDVLKERSSRGLSGEALLFPPKRPYREGSRLFEYDGKKLTSVQWAEATGIDKLVMISRLSKGWPIERAVTEPMRRKRRDKSETAAVKGETP